TRAFVFLARQTQDVAAVARDTFRHLASDTADLVESSVTVLDRLFARWDANRASVTVASPTLDVWKTEEPAPARPVPAEAIDPAARRQLEAEPWWSFPGLVWGGAVAVAFVTGRQLGRRRKLDRGPDRVSIG